LGLTDFAYDGQTFFGQSIEVHYNKVFSVLMIHDAVLQVLHMLLIYLYTVLSI